MNIKLYTDDDYRENVMKSGNFKCASCLDRFDKNVECPHCGNGKVEEVMEDGR